jgi:BirA family biotin operon repressor/biotin-[acetyl-CoA-carboxylase] ligase
MDVDPPGAGPVLDKGQLVRLSRTMFADVVQLAETTSTNSVLIERAAGGAPGGLVAVADYQSAGRGRFDRRWESPPGKSLLFSVLLRPSEQELPPPRRHLAVAAVSLSLVDGTLAAAGAELQLKWPNDLVVADRKVAGVLAESAPDGAVVVGAGVNVDWSPEGLPVTHLSATSGPPVDRGELLVETLLALDRLYGHWDRVSRRYRTTCATVGREVTVQLTDTASPLRGLAVAVDDQGRLIVRTTDGAQVTVAAGDVTHLRPTGAPSLSAQ